MGKLRHANHGRDHGAHGSDPVAGPWIDVETVDDPDSPGDPTYQFQNGWVNTGDPYENFQYRKGATGFESQGHVKDGASGSVVCTVLPDHRPLKNISFLTDVGDVGSFVIGRVEVDATSGDITITFPAS